MMDAPTGQAAFPLFFNDPRIVSLAGHGDATVRTDMGMAFARATNNVPLTLADVPEAAKHYPIAFTLGANPIPIAILGLENGNYFVDDGGSWMPNVYVPAYVRKYPFVLQEGADGGQMTLCVDESAIRHGDKTQDGHALYEDGVASPFVKSALDFCAAYQREYHQTRLACDTFVRLGLLAPRQADTKLASGRTIRLDGLAMLDEAKFHALASRDIVYLSQQGSLAGLFYILQSQSNWQTLLRIADGREGPAA
jgi:hypothetical protein